MENGRNLHGLSYQYPYLHQIKVKPSLAFQKDTNGFKCLKYCTRVCKLLPYSLVFQNGSTETFLPRYWKGESTCRKMVAINWSKETQGVKLRAKKSRDRNRETAPANYWRNFRLDKQERFGRGGVYVYCSLLDLFPSLTPERYHLRQIIIQRFRSSN